MGGIRLAHAVVPVTLVAIVVIRAVGRLPWRVFVVCRSYTAGTGFPFAIAPAVAILGGRAVAGRCVIVGVAGVGLVTSMDGLPLGRIFGSGRVGAAALRS